MKKSALFQFLSAQTSPLKPSGKICAYLIIMFCTAIQAGVIAQESGKERARPTGKIEKVTWDVVGGGDMAFEIVGDGEGF